MYKMELSSYSKCADPSPKWTSQSKISTFLMLYFVYKYLAPITALLKKQKPVHELASLEWCPGGLITENPFSHSLFIILSIPKIVPPAER
jgi:hypothetical protein